MPVIHATESAVHQLNGTTFTSYASPARGSRELCAWRVEIPGGTEGAAHQVSREEVLYMLSGTLRVTLDDETAEAAAGDVILVPVGARFSASNRSGGPATAWVTTTAGFARVRPDGTWFTPPWTR